VRFTLICSFVMLLAALASARILNVPSEYTTIQAGINASINGDTVLVAPGEYAEIDTIQDKNILLTSSEGPESTILHGYVYLWGASIDSTCILRGFDINGYNINILPDYLVYVISGSPIILGNIIENNTNIQWGAGVCLRDASATIKGNIIRSNWAQAYYGGGVFCANLDTLSQEFILIEGNIISGNRTGWSPDQGDGGGVDIQNRGIKGIIRSNLIINNTAGRVIYYAQGGGIRASGILVKIYNNTIVGNATNGDLGGQGGGLYFYSVSSSGEGFIKNNIIAYNLRGGGAYGTINDSTCTAWDYNLVFDNGGGDYLGFQPGPHDIQTDPLFINRFSGDYHLLSNSPCIDAGDPSLPLDPDSTRSDIGAYFFDQTVGIDEDENPSGPYQFTLSQNYPNPFNAQTVISYQLDKEAIVSLHIYSIMGHLVIPVVNKETQKAGEHRYTWEGRDTKGQIVSTGIYFYELYVDGTRQSKAMILIK
jgi:hypothetical protein